MNDDVQYKDQSTIISIYPHSINEFKPGLYPGRFIMKECEDEERPEFLVIGLSIHLVNIPDRPALQVETASYTIAKAVVRDFFDSQANHDAEHNAHPGLAALPGSVDYKTFKEKHSKLHDQMKSGQKAWGLKLVKENDNNWNRYHNHKMMLPLGLYFGKKFGFTADQKPWLADVETVLEQPRCPVCAIPVDTRAIVCTNCNPNFILKPEEYKKITEGRLVKVA